MVIPLSPTMSTTSSTRTRRESRDTGFPEPFCGERNTTWHHPEADTSPNASLCSDDITQEMIYQRQQRRSFFKKTRRTLSHGKVAAEPQFQGLAVVLAGPQPPRSRDGSEGGESEARVSKDSADSADSIQSNEPPSPTTSSHQKRNVLRKMWHSSSK